MSAQIPSRRMLIASVAFLCLGITIGWISRGSLNSSRTDRAPNTAPMDSDMLSEIAQLNAPAQIIVDKELGLVTVKGNKADVEQTQRMISMTREIASKSKSSTNQ